MIRYTLSHVGKDGFRQFTLKNTGTSHDATKEQAEQRLRSFLENNGPGQLESVFGPHVRTTVRVDPVECYDHGDRVGGGGLIEYHPDLDLDETDPKERKKMARAIDEINGSPSRYPILTHALKEPDTK